MLKKSFDESNITLLRRCIGFISNHMIIFLTTISILLIMGTIFVLNTKNSREEYMMDQTPFAINKQRAIEIATQKAKEIGFDVENLQPTAIMVEQKWDVQFDRIDSSLGGAPHFLIDGKTGAILEMSATQ